MSNIASIKEVFSGKQLKVTPQRIAVYKAMGRLGHACAEDVIAEVHKESPTITVSTIYNVLDCLAANKIISRILTGNNKMYFDISTHEHYHLYSETSHRIEDFDNTELVAIVKEYMRSKQIAGFDLKEVKVQLIGEFTN